MHFSSQGQGRPLLLVHGIGSSSRVWRPFLPQLASDRTVISVDLPGHGQSPEQQGGATFSSLVESLEGFLQAEGLNAVDMIGFSLGGRLVLELARRGRAGSVVALSPGGFWAGWERSYLQWTLLSSVNALRLLEGLLPGLAHNAATRSAVLAQLSARPWTLSGDEVEAELLSFTSTSTFRRLSGIWLRLRCRKGLLHPRRRRSRSPGGDMIASAFLRRLSARKQLSPARTFIGSITAATT